VAATAASVAGLRPKLEKSVMSRLFRTGWSNANHARRDPVRAMGT
jgi:hypothetical protein